MCQMPKLDLLMDKNPIYQIGPPSFSWSVGFTWAEYMKRSSESQPSPDGRVDFMAKFLEAKRKSPDVLDDNVIMMYLLANVVAGSDTTASTLCSAVYHVLKHPAVHDKLREELRSAGLSVPAKWKELQGLRYLEAVMRESMRINPGVGLLIERIVPNGGLRLSGGRYVPEGTIVGMNPWVVSRDPTVYGSEPDDFVPERWLQSDSESEEEYQARLSQMKGADLTFGAGTRVCLGRYISQLEAYKFIATIFTVFDVSLCWPLGV